MRPSPIIPLAIIAGGIIIAVAVYASIPKTPQTDAGNLDLVRPVGASDHILGNPAARVMILEYSDFDCEYCKVFHETLHQIVANSGTSGHVAWVFRHFPLSEVHPHALSHARAAECIAEVAGNDAFWRFADSLFANQPVDPSRYGELAASIGITGDGFATCYANPPSSLSARIMADRQNALDIGAGGTPYSIILVDGVNPIVIDNVYPYDVVKQLIDQALAQ